MLTLLFGFNPKESDPNIEEKDPDADPSLWLPSDPHSPDAPPESKNSGNEKILEGNNGTDEAFHLKRLCFERREFG